MLNELLPTEFQIGELARGRSSTIRNAITCIWTNFVRNFAEITEGDFTPEWMTAGEQKAWASWQRSDYSADVYYQFEQYNTLTDLLAQSWVQEVIALHPYLDPRVP